MQRLCAQFRTAAGCSFCHRASMHSRAPTRWRHKAPRLYASPGVKAKAARSDDSANYGSLGGTEARWDILSAGTRNKGLRPDLNLALVTPEIPQNTGTIARTCAAAAVALHLVKPLGFSIDSTRLKRAGLDYWPYVVVQVHESWEAFASYFQSLPDPKRMHAFTKFATNSYCAPGTYLPGDWLLFGAETTGLPAEARMTALSTGGDELKIPMLETHVRSLNLAVAAGIGLYEAVRQLDR